MLLFEQLEAVQTIFVQSKQHIPLASLTSDQNLLLELSMATAHVGSPGFDSSLQVHRNEKLKENNGWFLESGKGLWAWLSLLFNYKKKHFLFPSLDPPELTCPSSHDLVAWSLQATRSLRWCDFVSLGVQHWTMRQEVAPEKKLHCLRLLTFAGQHLLFR